MTEQTTQPAPTDLAMPEPISLGDLAERPQASLMLDPRAFEHMQRVAKVFAASKMVPQQYQGNVADCVIALELAHRLGVSVYMLMQASYVVHGRPGLEAKLAIALCNQRGPFKGPIQYAYTKDNKDQIVACTAHARHKNGENVEATITAQMVKAEGWDSKPGSKWKTIPEQMYAYRAAVFLIRRVCPEVIMGMQTVDELEDTYGTTRYVESESRPTGAEALAGRIISEPEREPEPDTDAEPESEAEPAGESLLPN